MVSAPCERAQRSARRRGFSSPTHQLTRPPAPAPRPAPLAPQRPLLLKGHERSITFLKYNAEGDLLFSCSKDNRVCVWRSSTGERIGTYEGHTGAIWGVDCSRDSRWLLSCSADMTVKAWDVATGRCVLSVALPGPVHAVAFAEGDRQFACANDPFGQEVSSGVHIFDFNAEAPEASGAAGGPRCSMPIAELSAAGSRIKVTRLGWLPLNEGLLAALDNGVLRLYDGAARGEVLGEWEEHEGAVSSFAFNDKKTLLITASHDRTAKLWDAKEMRVLHTYGADVPLNACAISPIREHVLIGGGQEAMAVTTTSSAAGKFETRFMHMVFEHELGRVKGHFGPINALAVHPDGQSFVSGAEDGYMRLHRLDPEYFSLGDEDNLDDPVLTAALADGSYEQLELEERDRLAKEAADQAAVAAAQGRPVAAASAVLRDAGPAAAGGSGED